MSAGIFNIVIGLVMVGAGASGRFKLVFFGPTALMVVGGCVAAFGAFQVIRAMSRKRQ